MKAVAGVPERIKRWACTAKLARTLRRAGDSRSASPDGVTKTMHTQRQARASLERRGRYEWAACSRVRLRRRGLGPHARGRREE